MSVADQPMGMDVLEDYDGWAHLRNQLRVMAGERNDYSGCPLPLPGMELVIEPTYQYKVGGMIFGDPYAEAEPPDDGSGPVTVRNIFWSHTKRCRVAVCEDATGIWGAPLLGSGNQITAVLKTLGACDAWGIEQEHAALRLLGELLPHRQFKQYLLTGTFTETSKRSGVTYLFRKLRPTVAISQRSGRLQILCALCMHPIGYYGESWAGCMVPTDDVVAHLMLMRGDERLFWKRCAQHPAYDPAAGV